MSDEPKLCQSCGMPLSEPQAACTACGEQGTPRVEVGEELEFKTPDGADALRLTIEELSEASPIRRLAIARPSGIQEQEGVEPHLVEELTLLLGAPETEVPASLRDRFRPSIGSIERGGLLLRAYAADETQDLEDLLLSRENALPYHELKRIGLALFELVEALHSEKRLYLRLSPWTLRIADLEGLERESDDLITSLGAEETFPEDEEFEEDVASAPTEEHEGADDDERETDIKERAPQDRERALLDGGRRLFVAEQSYDALPVITGFSAPELLTRASVEVTTACDIFSLGAILYFLVCGAIPPTSIYTRHAPALPPRAFRPEFPIGLGGVIDRATRADPSERYSSVAAMRDAWLEACAVIEARETARAFPPRARGAVERHVGIAKRMRNPTNQDQVFYAQSADGRFALMVVADGVSTASYGSGDLASEQLRAVAEERWPGLLSAWERDELPEHVETVSAILEESNERLVAYINEHFIPFEGSPHEVMGTTCLIALAHDGVVTLASLGDSRAYLQHGPHFERVTTDHNLWTLSVLEGLAADSALALPHGEALARCMGTFYIEDGILHPIPPQPDLFRFPIGPGDQLLLATDGLLDFAGPTGPASEDRVLTVLQSEANPALACLELVLLANRGGGGDNVGVGIIQFQ